MTSNNDVTWDELGIAWRAVDPEIEVVSWRLKARLLRQSLLIAAIVAVALPLSIAGVALGGYTIWIGWTGGAWFFVTRGTAIIAVSIMLALAAAWLLPVRAGAAAKTLAQMLDLAIARAERGLRTLRLGMYACLTLGVVGLAGTALRTYAGKAPQLSPALDLAVLGAIAVGALLARRTFMRELRVYRYLKGILTVDKA